MYQVPLARMQTTHSFDRTRPNLHPADEHIAHKPHSPPPSQMSSETAVVPQSRLAVQSATHKLVGLATEVPQATPLQQSLSRRLFNGGFASGLMQMILRP